MGPHRPACSRAGCRRDSYAELCPGRHPYDAFLLRRRHAFSIAWRSSSCITIKSGTHPPGTALYTADLIREARREAPAAALDSVELVQGARGADAGGVHIHSVRLPGLVAHQEVIFGLPGQTLTIRHDSIHRECFMPGVLAALRRVHEVRGVLIGLEKLLFD